MEWYYLMKTDILLIYPPFHRLYGEKKEWMPLGILTLAAYLNQNGIHAVAYNADCSTLDEPETVMTYKERFSLAQNYQPMLKSDSYIWDEYKQVLLETNPTVVGMTVLTEAIGSVKKLVQMTRAFNDEIVIILGGQHAEIDPVLLLKEVSCDFVIQGEGEIPLLKLMKNIILGSNEEEDLIEIEGLCYYRDGIFQRNAGTSRLDVDALPIPKLENHYDFQRYKKIGKKLSVATSRGGCIYSCSFCYCSKFRDKILWRTPRSVFDEISYYVNTYKTKKIFFIDDTFTCNREMVVDLCYLFIENDIPIEWTCTTHVNRLDQELLSLMKRAGCSSIHIGAESGSNRLLSLMNKSVKASEILSASKAIKKSGIECRTFFMVGLPTESKCDIKMSIDLLKRIAPDEAILNIYVPIPQTAFFDYIKQHYFDITTIDWLTFSRNAVPYEKYMDHSFGDVSEAISELFDLVESINSQKGT